jgi:hypothetical protein
VDGKNMIWLYGSGRASETGVYPTVAYMTSPLTTDPAQLQPHRLRSEMANGFGTGLMQLGCGFAAWGRTDGIRALQLSDGTSWLLLDPQGAPWRWVEPLAVTCSHLYAMVQAPLGNGGSWTSTIARVRLDSLGPGIPPD